MSRLQMHLPGPRPEPPPPPGALVTRGRRIGLVLPGLGLGGAERVVAHLAQDLTLRDHRISVVATTRGGLRVAELIAAGVDVTVLGLEQDPDLRRGAARLRQWMKARELHVVHSHLAVADILTGWARTTLRHRPRWLVTVHNPGVELSLAKRLAWAASLRLGARVLAVGASVAARTPGPVRAIVHPSPVDPTAPVASRDACRRSLGVGSEPLVLFVGRLSTVKGADRLVALADALPNVRVVAIGDGPERARLEASRVECWGPRRAPEVLLPAADVLVVPSRSEGFPQVVLEAMATRTPLVATSVPGTLEALAPDCAHLVPESAGPAGLVEAVRDVLQRPRAAAERAERARRRLIEHDWTRRSMVDAHEALYARDRFD